MKIADFSFETPARPAASPALEQAVPGESLVAAFRAAAAQHAARPAVRDPGGGLTYGELETLSDRLANFILGLDLGPAPRVGLMFDRHRYFAAAVLGVLKAGGAWVPLEPSLPLERRRHLLERVGAGLLISQASLAGELSLLQWRCPGLRHILALDAQDLDTLVEDPGALMSSELWDHLAGDQADDVLAGGWKSAFTGLPLPPEAMAAFGDNARRKAQALLPPGGRVLEIGCASGFTMRQVAPLAGFYLALDLSRRNVERVQARAQALGLGQVQARQLAAHDVDLLAAGSFDLVILNSVIESFPGFAYLRQVLAKVLDLLAPGGAVLVGSVWDQGRKDAYLADLADFARRQAGQGFQTTLDLGVNLFVPRQFFADWAAEQARPMALEFSAVEAPGFEPAAYAYDLAIRPGQPPAQAQEALKRRHGLPAVLACPATPPNLAVGPQDSAYVIFTSGTTGQPKGVVVEHHSAANLARALQSRVLERLGRPGPLNISCLSSFGFDPSVQETFGALLHGHCLHLVSDQVKQDPGQLHAFIEERDLDLCDTTPSLFGMLLDHWRAKNLRTRARAFIMGGEVMRADMLEAFYALEGHGGVRVVNAYGPTECCVSASMHLMTAANWREILPIPIGTPLPGVEIRVRDALGRDLPQGVPGQIWIGGAGLARGYLDEPEQTAQAFVSDGQGRRWYLTGDLGLWLEGGLLRFLGREDRQVKVRGNRVELSEVEKALASHPLVRRAAVVAVDPHGQGELSLAAYLVPRPGLEPARLKAELDQALPSALVPSWLVCVDELPRNANDKLDLARLPAPWQALAQDQTPAQPLEGPDQQLMAQVWSQVLEVPVADAQANFFTLGGHSVLAVRLMSELERQTGVRLPLAELFAHPTVASLAKCLEDRARARAWSPVVRVNQGNGGAPVFFFHPVGGNVLCYQALAQRLEPGQPVYMVQALGLEEGQALLPSVEEMVAAYLPEVRRALEGGPVSLAGWSFGGLLAYEAAVRLQRSGVAVRRVMLFDAVAQPSVVRDILDQDEPEYLATLFEEVGPVTAEELRPLGPEERLDYLIDMGKTGEMFPQDMDRAGMRRLLALFQNNALAAVRYRPQPLEGPLLLVRPQVATRITPNLADRLNGWGPLAQGGVTLRWMACTHGQMLAEPFIDELAGYVRQYLDTGQVAE